MDRPIVHPQEGTARESRTNARMATIATLIAFALFAVFYSEGARRFTRDLPGNALTDVLVNAADGWHGLMQELGTASLAPAIRDGLEWLRHFSW